MKRTIDYQITRADEGIRIEQFLRRQGFSGQNLTLIKRMPQNILLNGQFVYMKDNVHAGDTCASRSMRRLLLKRSLP